MSRSFWMTCCAGVLVLFPACYTPPLTEAGKGVQLTKGDPPTGCRELGAVAGRGDDEEIKTALRNNAARKGGNYVRMETFDSARGTMTGTAFRCGTTD